MNCLRYKQRREIKNNIMEYISIVRDREELTWEQVIQEWPSIGDEEWFNLVMQWCGSVSESTLTGAIKDEILKKLIHDEDQEEDDVVSQSQVHM